MASKKKMKQYKVVIILGESGSGKDSLAREIVYKLDNLEYPVHQVVACTTRPKRDYEIEGCDYHFLTPNEFADLIMENKMLEAATFNDWAYGTCIDDLKPDQINIEVLNPEGTDIMSEDTRIDMCIVRCICNEKERLIRQLNREEDPDIDEIIRRLETDRIDFSNFNPRHCSNWVVKVYTDRGLTLEEEAELALEHILRWANKDN